MAKVELNRSVLLLARLTRLDPGGNWGNRPKSSLETIFIWWLYFHPNAKTSLPGFLQIIDTLYQREPAIAWNLLMNLLFDPHMSLMERTTRWRDWVTEASSTFIIQDLMDASDAILEKLISNAGANIARWCSLINKARFMTVNQKDVMVGALEILQSQQFSLVEQVQISDCLRREIFDYRKFFESDWSMSIENIQRLEAILRQVEPDDLVYRHRELFKYVGGEDGIIEDLRLKALAEILNLQGWDGIIQLAQQVQAASFVGVTLAQAQLLPIELNVFFRENLGSPDRWRHELASSYIRCNAFDRGELWIDACLNDNLSLWSVEEYGKFLLCLPFNLCLLARLDDASLETQHYFWSHVENVKFLGVERTDWVLTKLLEFGRPHLAVTQIAWVLEKNPELFSLDLIAEVVELSDSLAGTARLQNAA